MLKVNDHRNSPEPTIRIDECKPLDLVEDARDGDVMIVGRPATDAAIVFAMAVRSDHGAERLGHVFRCPAGYAVRKLDGFLDVRKP